MRYKLILILSLLVLLSCDDEKDDPLVAQLSGTLWTIEKAELIENGDVINTLQPNADFSVTLSFGANKYIHLSSLGDGCGQWTVNNSKLRFKILYQQLLPALCQDENFSNIFFCDDKIQLTTAETLIIDGAVGALDGFTYLSDWAEILDDINQGKIQIRTYFIKNAGPQPPHLSCCGKL